MSSNKKSIHPSTLTLDSVRAREIVSVVLDFGVSETQIKKIIKFLSLELLDRDLMTKVSSLVDESFEHVDDIKTKIEI
jgi:hypothetical protein